MTGSEILIEGLKREGVEVIFGYPGGSVLPLCDHLFNCGLRFILVRHEQGAAHAADGYARASGKVGVCMATSGPGSTNLVTGIATAYMDSIPIVAITGQVATHLIGNDAFQEVDTTGITRPITKHNYLVKNVAELPRVIREAFHIASTGRPGPVLIDLPVDVQRAEGKADFPEKVELRSYRPTYHGHPLQLQKAATLICQAQRPVILAGGGVILSNASERLQAFVEKTGIPVAFTLMGLGSLPSDHRLSLGMLGMHGTRYANYAVMEADLLIAMGCRFDDRVTGKLDKFAPSARVIHIDIDPAAISKNVRVDIPIVGDVKNVLGKLIEMVEPLSLEKWHKEINQWKERYPVVYEPDGLKPQMVIETISHLTRGQAIICTEVGQNQMWTAQFYRFKKPRTLITSGGLGTMGFGFPAAIGAQVANPEATVIDIAGDGSIQMNIQELATAVSNHLPVKVIILNNCCLGMVRQWQQLFYRRRYAFTCLQGAQPDFVKLAEAYGALGLRVKSPDQLESVLKQALAEKRRPVLVDCQVEQEENVFPMVPAGASLDEMIDGLA